VHNPTQILDPVKKSCVVYVNFDLVIKPSRIGMRVETSCQVTGEVWRLNLRVAGRRA
jgi:hypothetical protein